MNRSIAIAILFLTWNLQSAEIHDACRRGDLATVKKIVTADPNALNLPGDNKLTPLMIAARANAAVTEFLLQKKADLKQQDAMGCTAMHHAAIKHQAECINVLVKFGGDVNAKDAEGVTPSIYAAGKLGPDRKETLRALIENKADIAVRDKRGYSVRLYAKKDPELAAILKELGAKY